MSQEYTQMFAHSHLNTTVGQSQIFYKHKSTILTTHESCPHTAIPGSLGQCKYHWQNTQTDRNMD